MKLHEAKFIVGSGGRLGKKTYSWNVPIDLNGINKKNPYRSIVGLGRWKNSSKELYIAVSQGDEIIFFNKKIFLQIARDVRKLRNKI